MQPPHGHGAPAGMGMPALRFAIIDSNTLMCLGLQQILTEMLPMVETEVFASFQELENQDKEQCHFLHYFVSSRIYFEHSTFFRQNPKKSIILVNGDMQISGMHTLNVCQSEPMLMHDLLMLRNMGKSPVLPPNTAAEHREQLLSPREIEVAILLCKGLINKEIADRLDISITTVISHRKNIMEKLHARSLADIIIYSVMNGLVSVEQISGIR